MAKIFLYGVQGQYGNYCAALRAAGLEPGRAAISTGALTARDCCCPAAGTSARRLTERTSF